MTAYADASLFEQFTAGLTLDIPAGYTVTNIVNGVTITTTVSGTDALLERASRDLDAYLAWPAPAAAGLRINPATLTAFQADCLQQACVRQAAYRLTIEEEDLTEGTPRILNTGTLTLASTPPDRIGADVLVILQGAGLLRRSGCAAPPVPRWPWSPYPWSYAPPAPTG